MHEFRDIQNVPGVARPKSSQDMGMATRMADSGDSLAASTAGFAQPPQNILAAGVQPGMKVGDFGAGSGAYTLGCARTVGRTGKVYAVEVQKDLLTRIRTAAAAEHMENIEIIWGDFEMPHGSRIADASLDRVFLSNTLFQLDNKIGALHEAQRVLKPSGKLILIDWADSFGGMGPEKSAVVTEGAATKLLTAAGFAIAGTFPAGAHHYGLIATPLPVA